MKNLSSVLNALAADTFALYLKTKNFHWHMSSLRAAHVIASEANDYATTSLIEIWIDETERRAWFLFEATR